MQWEKLNKKDFAEAVKASGGVCVLPVGSMELHGEHLALGTDYLVAQRMCELAAEREPAVVFPALPLGQVSESMAAAGSIALDVGLIMQLIRGLCAEIARNGFRKILVVNGHGGNEPMLNLLAFSDSSEPRDYMVYYAKWYQSDEPALAKMIADDCQGRPIGHACEWETSLAMALCGEECANLAYAPEETVQMQSRSDGLEGQVATCVDWFSKSPQCYIGNARHATAERGRRYAEFYITRLAKLIRAVKDDRTLPAVAQEYFRRSRNLT